MKDTLRWYPTEGRFEYKGREWLLTSDFARLIFAAMLLRKGEWMDGPYFWPILWPAQIPTYPGTCVWHHMKILSIALLDTSLKLERTRATTGSGRRAMFRITGDVDVMPAGGTICEHCHGLGRVG